MALAEARIVVQFAGGVETKQDHKGVLPARMLAVENAVFSKAISLVKRYGYEDLGGVIMGAATTLPPPVALGRRGFELLAFTGDEAYSFIDDATAWMPAGAVQSVICDHEPVAKTGSDQTLADMATLAGVAVYAWEDSRGGVWYSVLDDYTGRSLVAPTQVDAGGERPRVHAVGEFVHVYWVRAAAQEIRVWRISPSQPLSVPIENILITSIDGALPIYDVDTDDEKAVIVWRNTDAQIGVGYVHQEGGIGGAGFGMAVPVAIAETPASALAVAIDKTVAAAEDRRVAVVWSTSSQQRYVMLDAELAAEFATRAVIGGFDVAEMSTCVFLEDDSEAGHRQLWIASEDLDQPHRMRFFLVDSNASVFAVQASRDQRGLVLGSKAFLDNGEAYVHTQRDSTLYRTYYTQRIADGLVVARFLPGLAGGRLSKAHLPSVGDELGPAGRAVHFAAVYVTDVESKNGDVFTEKGVRRVSLDFRSPDAFRSAQLGRTLYLAGGLVQAYDGERITEAGFHYGPDDLATPTLDAPTTGPGLADGTYGYVAVYENTLANGEVERGPVSPAVLVTVTGGPRRVTVVVPTYRWTTKPGARIGLFRSPAGDASIFSRVSSLDPTTAGQVNGYVANDPTVDSVIFIDEMDDATLDEQDPLYTNGGIEPNDPLGAARLIAGGKGRLFVVDSSQPNRIYFSQEKDEVAAVELGPNLFLDIDPFGGDINGLIVMDDSLIVFKESAIFTVDGAGPAPNLTSELGGAFRAQLVTSDVGCISPDSLVYTPVGVPFQSRKGIYQLGRDKSVTYVGAPVEAYNGQTVVAANLIEDRTQIRFLTNAGVTLLYDYLFGQWSTFTNHEGQDAVVVDGAYHYLRNDGQVWVETPAVYRDNNSQIPMLLGTAHLKLAGHTQGFQRLWYALVIGEYRSPHRLRMRGYYDYEDQVGDEWLLDPAGFINLPGYGEGAYGAGNYGEGAGGTPSRRYEIEVHVGRQCSAVRFTFEFLEDTGVFGAAGEITEMILTGGVLRQRAVLTDARRQ